MDKERYQTQVAQSITPLVSSTYSYEFLSAAINCRKRQFITIRDGYCNPLLCKSRGLASGMGFAFLTVC